MFLHSTNNNLAAGLDATSLPSHSDELPPLTRANAEVLCPSCNHSNSLLPQASRQLDVQSPAFLALVVVTVKQAVAADQTPTSLKQVQAWLGAFPRHSHPACNPKHWPWQFLAWAFHQFWLLSPERLTKCNVGQTLLSRPLSKLFHCWHLLLLLCLRMSRPGFSPPRFPLHQMCLFYSSRLWWHLAFRPSHQN